MQISKTDTRTYKFSELDNGLKVLVISDEQTENGTACMTVRVGGADNPKDVPGLAHFLEHMLFMGSSKYPDESHYDQIVCRNGGEFNGWTSENNTSYYFKVNLDKFASVLDVFSRFFIDPLFSQNSLDKEMNAVDAEFNASYNDDSSRAFSILESLMDKSCPITPFNIGNIHTLKATPNIRDVMIDFYKSHYSADKMNLVVVSKASVDDTLEMVREKFSDVKRVDTKKKLIVGLPYTDILQANSLVPFIEMVPNKNKSSVTMMWQLPGYFTYKSKAYQFWGHIIGYEGKNSLLSYLKDQDLATALYAGDSDHKLYRTFTVGIDLTDKGNADVHRVIALTLQFIKGLSGHEDQMARVYGELRAMNHINFDNKSKEDQVEYASQLSMHLHEYAAEHTVSGQYYMSEYGPSVHDELLSYYAFISVKPIVTHRSKQYLGKTTHTEKYYGTDFNLKFVPQGEAEPAPFGFPEENVYIPKDFSLVTCPHPRDPKLKPKPTPLAKTDRYEAWFSQDVSFGVPKVTLGHQILLPQAVNSSQARLHLKLYVDLFSEYINETLYDTQDLYTFSVSPQAYGIYLHLYGYHDKILTVWKTITDNVFTFNISNKLFSQRLAKLKRTYQDYEAFNTLSQIKEELSLLLYDSKMHYKQALEQLAGTTHQDMLKYQKTVFGSHYVISCVNGNCTEDVALTALNQLMSKLSLYLPTQSPNKVTPETMKCPIRSQLPYGLYERAPYNDKEADVNTSYLLYYDIGSYDDLKTQVFSEIFSNILGEKYFTELRTNQQVGYCVQANCSQVQFFDKRQRSLVFCIQSPTHDGPTLHTKTQEFISTLKITEQEFTEAALSYIKVLSEPFQSLGESFDNMQEAVESRRFDFDEDAKLIKAAESATYGEFTDFCSSVFTKEQIQIHVN